MNFKSFAIVALSAAALAGCDAALPDPSVSAHDAQWLAMARDAPVNINDERYMIDDPTGQAPGTIVVDTRDNYLYFVLPAHKAIRYGVATGAEAYGWTGTATVGRVAEWPRWIPPADMVARWPYLKPTADAGGLPGGPENPLGARALYLYDHGKDTLYRIHGTNEPEQIGQGVSSGCIRMRNIDAIDLYNRVQVGTKVIVE